MNTPSIIRAGELIAELDPALAQLWLRQPFQRHNIVSAFHRSLSGSRYAALADEIAVNLRSAIDSTTPAPAIA
jgi:hypothetical protein